MVTLDFITTFFSLVKIFDVICGCTYVKEHDKSCILVNSHALLSTCSAKRALAILAHDAGDITGANAGDITGVWVSIKRQIYERTNKTGKK